MNQYQKIEKKGQQVFLEITLMFKNKKEVSIVIRNNG